MKLDLVSCTNASLSVRVSVDSGPHPTPPTTTPIRHPSCAYDGLGRLKKIREYITFILSYYRPWYSIGCIWIKNSLFLQFINFPNIFVNFPAPKIYSFCSRIIQFIHKLWYLIVNALVNFDWSSGYG